MDLIERRQASYRDLLRRAFISVLGEPRETHMDGELHTEGVCCGPHDIMGKVCHQENGTPNGCGGRLHQQPMYHGIGDCCERCPQDDHFWQPRGSYELESDSESFVSGEVLW